MRWRSDVTRRRLDEAGRAVKRYLQGIIQEVAIIRPAYPEGGPGSSQEAARRRSIDKGRCARMGRRTQRRRSQRRREQYQEDEHSKGREASVLFAA
jgi:hypothetical protein